MRSLAFVSALAFFFAGACGSPRGPAAPRFASAFAAAVEARDARAAAALFAPDADASLVAEPAVHGRAAIAAALDGLFARFAGAHVAVGRIWVGPDRAVIEAALTARRADHAIGVVAAVVVAFDRDGAATTARLYVDRPTVVGQLDPSRLPEGARTRAAVTAPPAGAAIAIAHAPPTEVEAADLAATDAIWARLSAHDPDGVLAPSSDDYVYDDFSGPAPLGKDATRALVVGFLRMVPDFTIASEQTRFAAGDDVITESVEHMTFQGRAVTLHAVDVKHFAGGKVTREWQYADGAEVLTALLGLPPLQIP